MQRNYERWIWLELIGFDRNQADYGVSEYLDVAGFVPEVICLMLSAVDFVLLHEGLDEETALPPDICAREGHEHNQDRKRQRWTNQDVRGLVAALHACGVEVFVTVFAQYSGDRHHREWASDHPEVLVPYPSLGRKGGLNVLRRLRDGTYFEDFFLRKLLEVLNDYRFDGWHGADGYGPLSGPIYEIDFSDDIVEQFVQARGVALGGDAALECGDDYDKLLARARWIWRNARHEWIEFWTDRWAGFWGKAVAALHGARKKAVINSSWGRAPFESLYRYGIDYKKITATGVDGIVVETVAASLCMDARSDCPDISRHYDFLSMLMLIKAYVPTTRLFFLHTTHDIVEQWDALRHAPTVLEREIHSLPNVFVIDGRGRLRRAADGLLVCLGDGIRRHEWAWLRRRWDHGFAETPRCAVGATLVWSDAALRNQVADFTGTRSWFTHRILSHLMTVGAPIQAVINIRNVAKAEDALLCVNPHLFPPAELDRLFAYENGPVICIGRNSESLPRADFEFAEPCAGERLWCGVYGADGLGAPALGADRGEEMPGDVEEIVDPRGYWEHLVCRPVSLNFLAACAEIVRKLSNSPRVLSGAEEVTVTALEHTDGALRLTVKNHLHVYAIPEIDVGTPIESVRLVTEFPMMPVTSRGTIFTVKVPPKGVVVLDIMVGS